MSITIQMFQTAMETYGAEQRSSARIIAGNGLPVPGFIVSGINFFHSGTDYIVTIGKEVPEEILKLAMAEFGEKYPGKENFCWGEIHSLKGILTLSAMLDGKYSKELVDELTKATYKKLLVCSSIPNVGFPFYGTPGMERLYEVLTEYSNTVNPFGNTNLNLKEFDFKEPTQYLDDVQVSIALREEKPYRRLILSTNSSKATFKENEKGWFYDTYVPQGNGYISMGHYYSNGIGRPVDEVVRLRYKVNKANHNDHPDDIDLKISLKTGLAWKSFHERLAEPATDEQIEIIITHLKMSIEEIRKGILCKMTT